MMPELIKVKTASELAKELTGKPIKEKLDYVIIGPEVKLDTSVGFFERLEYYINNVNWDKVLTIAEVLAEYIPVIGKVVKIPLTLIRGTIMPDSTVSKPFWQSKTFWINVIAIGASVFGLAEDAISPETTVIILGVLNVLLRLITKKSVTIS